MNQSIIKVLIGQRRSGKSMLLIDCKAELITHYSVDEASCIVINKELIEFDHIQTYKDLYDAVVSYTHIFVDEIQDIKEREKAIRGLQAVWWKDIYITWSNSHLLAWELATYLSGRYIALDVYPFDYREFLQVHDLQNTKTSFDLYQEYGGMPYLSHIWLHSRSKEYLKSVYETIVLHDVVKRYAIRNVDFFQKLMQFIALNVWLLFSALTISNVLAEQNIDIWSGVITEYLSNAQSALYLHGVERFDLRSKKIFERKQKWYFTDIWIRNCLIWWWVMKHIWWVLENIVFINLKTHWYTVYIWERYDKEIDFVAEKDGMFLYIQVAYLLESQQTIEREFGNLKAIPNDGLKYVLSTDAWPRSVHEWIIHMNIWDFLIWLQEKEFVV